MNHFLFFIIAMTLLPWLFGSYAIFGFNITGWSWVLTATLSSLLLLKSIKFIAFPLTIWLPWLCFLSLYWFLGRENPYALQSFLQMVSPFAVCIAASTFRPTNQQLENIVFWITRLAWIAWILLLIRMPMIFFGILPVHGFMAAEMIGLLLLGACYASFYACGSKRHLLHYCAMVLITLISLTRGPIIAISSCLPLTIAPLGIRKRLILSCFLIVFALLIFNTERMQQRMFYSGSGEITDLRYDNPNLRTTGRISFYDILWTGFQNSPILGNGFNSYRSTFAKLGMADTLPHNDWLKLMHDIGIVGAGLYLLTMIIQTLHLFRIARFSNGVQQMLAYGAASAFVPYALIMMTDNVILYVQYFGNLHFALIGIIYGAIRAEWEEYNYYA